MKTSNSGLGDIGTEPTLENSVYENTVNEIQKELLISELDAKGIKYTKADIVFIVKDKKGRIVWLEKGNTKAGLQHILDAHEKDFSNKGISKNEIPYLLLKALSEGKDTGKIQGRFPGRPIYEVKFHGNVFSVAITVSSNGFIVGANPCN